ncbi:MAG: hypothetical protein NPIRA02_42340 [Nitrospirales bacterium]|nr:MAG: hypothetical protein NPIRA02_42340 [Nitrospirales bacterium]
MPETFAPQSDEYDGFYPLQREAKTHRCNSIGNIKSVSRLMYCSPEFKPPVHVVRAEIGAGSGNLTLDADAPRCTTASTE